MFIKCSIIHLFSGHYMQSDPNQDGKVDQHDNAGSIVMLDGEIYFIHSNQVNYPAALTDSQGTVVWRWKPRPFGDSLADEDPDGDGQRLAFNLRFPGQYFDAETGLHYNYFRNYDPAVGRYVENDPIGIVGGLNTYGYVGGNPLIYIDPKGLENPYGLGGLYSQYYMVNRNAGGRPKKLTPQKIKKV
jgi:RHS repeat-associated protein